MKFRFLLCAIAAREVQERGERISNRVSVASLSKDCLVKKSEFTPVPGGSDIACVAAIFEVCQAQFSMEQKKRAALQKQAALQKALVKPPRPVLENVSSPCLMMTNL